MGDHHTKRSEDRVHVLEKLEVQVDDFECDGFILDIGGGGEGIIGRLKGEKVIAIDYNRAELEEAPSGPLKLVMDAKKLLFVDNTFNTATSFFALMYMDESEHQEVINEVFRVLKPGGRFKIWDVVLPACTDKNKDSISFYIRVKLPGEVIETGYGTTWPRQKQDVSYYAKLAEKAGFGILVRKETGPSFFLELQKPER